MMILLTAITAWPFTETGNPCPSVRSNLYRNLAAFAYTAHPACHPCFCPLWSAADHTAGVECLWLLPQQASIWDVDGRGMQQVPDAGLDMALRKVSAATERQLLPGVLLS